jgi:hypothetical protein
MKPLENALSYVQQEMIFIQLADLLGGQLQLAMHQRGQKWLPTPTQPRACWQQGCRMMKAHDNPHAFWCSFETIISCPVPLN